MKLAFILPGIPKPIGGFKFIYRLAEDLSKNHSVVVYHQSIDIGSVARLKYIILLRLNKFRRYPLETFNIKVRYLFNDASLLTFSHMYVCSWQLLKRNFSLIERSPNRFKHIVMDLPGYMGRAEDILYVWRNLKIEYLTISNYLTEYFTDNVGGKVKYIGCLLPKVFKVDRSINRDIDVLMNYSTGSYKNSEMVVTLSLELRKLGLSVCLFGRESNSDLENAGVIFFVNLNDEEISKIYQRSKVFVSISHFEGFGLPALEALYYGAHLVTWDYYGNRDYLDDRIMSIVSGDEDLVEFIAGRVSDVNSGKSFQRVKSLNVLSKWLKFSDAQFKVLLGL
jgi:hypothetical protein